MVFENEIIVIVGLRKLTKILLIDQIVEINIFFHVNALKIVYSSLGTNQRKLVN